MKKQAILALSSLLLLSGCAGATATISDASETIMTIGSKTYTKGDEYELLKMSNGAKMTVELIRQAILDEEIGRGDEIIQAANEQYDSYAETTEDLEQQIIDAGYKDKEEYIEKVLIPAAQTTELTDKYFTDAKKEIRQQYKPSLAKILVCDDEKTAEKALQALKDGTDEETVFTEYQSSSSSYSNEDTLITTSATDLPTRLINTLYKQNDAGVVDEIFTDEDNSSSTTAYVAILVNNDYDEIIDQVKENLSSNSTISDDCLVYYLEKYNFEVHDQDIFDYLKVNNPEYLIDYPELAEESTDSQS